jgi:cholesterol oxidase
MAQRLSTPPEQIKPAYTVVVVGSGYGGGVAASRLARAGQSVCLLERGKELQPGEYPVGEVEALAHVQVDVPEEPSHRPSTKLFDFRVNPEMNVLIGCGLGGTSLINANVGLEPDPRVWNDPRWPAAVRADRAGFAAGVDRAVHMLGATPYPQGFPGLRKLDALQMVADRMQAPMERPPLYVTFEDGPNAAGVTQRACILCGDCVTGCNHLAKNTTLMNYLPDARCHGAEIFCEVGVRWVERSADGRWAVRYQLLGAGREDWDAEPLTVTADVVILAAGTLGSTEILLRSAEHGLAVSQQLGQRFSGNGDVLAFSYNGDEDRSGVGFGSHLPPPDGPHAMEPVGPCITGVIRGNDDADLRRQFIVEEGSFPAPIAAMLPEVLAVASHLGGARHRGGLIELVKEKERELASLVGGARHGAVRNSVVFLGMSFDDARGVMSLQKDRLRITWPGVGTQPDALEVNRRLSDGSAALGGVYVKDPIWSKLLGQRLITVHPLGGCAMGENADGGVVDHRGEVFDAASADARHRGLYVMDGAVVPMALGLNPSLTIAALAERNCALLAAERGWPVDMTPAPPAPPAPVSAGHPGIEFTEVMRGFIAPRTAAVEEDIAQYQAAATDGERAGAAISFEMTIRGDDVAAIIADPDHGAEMAGTVVAPTLASGTMVVTGGTFQCFSEDATRVATRNLVYRMTMRAQDGRSFHLHGFKMITPGSVLELWPQTTTLYVTVREGGDEDGAVVALGVMRVHAGDFLKQMSTMRPVGADTLLDGLRARVEFGRFFAGELFETYGGIFAHTTAVDPKAPPRVRRPLRAPAPEVHGFRTDDGVDLLLTRYRGGDKGPVMLSHGLGVSSLIFSIDTINVNLLEYLVAHRYDVWLLDYRASIVLPAAQRQFSGDEIAVHDYPAAVRTVQQVTGASDIQVVAHCFGSTTFFMAMLAGLQGVRSAVCSQIGAHVLPVELTRIKAGLHLDGLVTALGVKTMTAYAEKGEGWRDQLFDDMLRLNPVGRDEHCDSEVCHRITFLYSLLYEHAQLDATTHAVLHEMFGVANVGALDHLATMVRHHQIVDAAGNDTYLPHVQRLAIPISIVHGAQNHCFLPVSTERTLEWMAAANGAGLYDRRLIPGYGHIDCIFGRDAARDVYPYIVERLDLHATAGS